MLFEIQQRNGGFGMGHSRFMASRQGLFREAFLNLFPVPRNLHYRAGHVEAISWTPHYREVDLLNASIYGASLIYFMQSI
jgi:hypothetical protein